ncbi:MAG TPA: phosphoribosylglycinamide formyltransferase [Sphingomicrobium sp.]|nr:phosphoribosylglycinamide formyltransferase [Sphingomicrobium sp.]
MRDPKRVAILISGRGSNMRALVEEAQGYEVVLVGSNNPMAPGLRWAAERQLETWALESKGLAREEFDQRLSNALDDQRVGTVALAGFMRILSPWFVTQWRGRVLNIHPSLLPKYRGLDTHARAIAAGEAVSGCSVHVLTEELDAGEVLGQAEVPIAPDDTPEDLAERVLAAEHVLYPKILSRFVNR